MDKTEIADALKDDDFINDILEMQTSEEVKDAFAEKGIDISVDEVKTIGAIINEMVEKDTTDLSEEDLEAISGGFSEENISNTYEAYDVLDKNVSKKPEKHVNW